MFRTKLFIKKVIFIFLIGNAERLGQTIKYDPLAHPSLYGK